MKLYIVTSAKNLQLLNDQLRAKYRTIEIHGVNDLMEGITSITTKHIMEEYSAMIIINQSFEEEDLRYQRQLSRKFNEACAYALKDLPIYFLCQESNTNLLNSLKQNLTGGSVKAWPYKGNLQMSIIEEIIKEVRVLSAQQPSSEDAVRNDIIAAKELQKTRKIETNIDRVMNMRKSRDSEDFSKLLNIQNIIKTYATTDSSIENIPVNVAAKSSLLSNLKEDLLQSLDAPAVDTKLQTIDKTILSKRINPESIKTHLLGTDESYATYSGYMTDLMAVIEKVKASDAPNKADMILQLMEEKSKTNHELHKIYTEYLGEILKSSVNLVVEEQRKGINELQEYGDTKDVDLLLGKEFATLQELKKAREDAKEQVKHSLTAFTEVVRSVHTLITDTSTAYLTSAKEIETEMRDFANENGVALTMVELPNKKEINSILVESYNEIRVVSNALIDQAKNVMTKMAEVIKTDDMIIDKQDEVIDVLQTQKVKKVLVVENLLKTKLIGILGPNGVGKTHTALNMAIAHRRQHKTLLFDLNISSPSLRFYNREKDPTVDEKTWFNRFTITLDEFVRIPVGSNMHSLIPFKDNLTVIQPDHITTLEEYQAKISPGVFSMHVESFLEALVGFYDRIIIIFPEDPSAMMDLLKNVGYLYYICDFNPMNQEKSKHQLSELQSILNTTPSKYFIINKEDKFSEMTMTDYLSACGVDSRQFKITPLPTFSRSIADKLAGRIPSEGQANIKTIFENLINK